MPCPSPALCCQTPSASANSSSGQVGTCSLSCDHQLTARVHGLSLIWHNRKQTFLERPHCWGTGQQQQHTVLCKAKSCWPVSWQFPPSLGGSLASLGSSKLSKPRPHWTGLEVQLLWNVFFHWARREHPNFNFLPAASLKLGHTTEVYFFNVKLKNSYIKYRKIITDAERFLTFHLKCTHWIKSLHAMSELM